MHQKLTGIIAAVGMSTVLAIGLTLTGAGTASAAPAAPSASPSGAAPTDVVCRTVRVCDEHGCRMVRRCWED